MNFWSFVNYLDLSELGLLPAEADFRYDCTPVDAEVFAQTGVDGLHLCILPDYGQMVFCVDPSGCHTPEVYPLAEDFEDFVRLLLGCGSVWNLIQCMDYPDEEAFREAVKQTLEEDSVRDTLSTLAEVTDLTPRRTIYEPLQRLQEIDRSHIHHSEEYKELHHEPEPARAVPADEEREILGEVFECHRGKRSFDIRHPLTGELHILTVTSCHAKTLELSSDGYWEYPNRYRLLTCQITPDTKGWFLRSVSAGDTPRRLHSSGNILGGADFIGILCAPSQEDNRCFASAPCFVLPKETEWQMVWHFTQNEEEILPD